MTKAKVRDKYRGLSRQELLDKAYELGSNYEIKSTSCSQSTVAAVHELLDIDDVIVQAATSLCGGSANQFLGTCGALSGGIMILDCYTGRPAEKMSHRERIQANIDALEPASVAPELLADKFWKEYGTIICAQIHRQLFGRIFGLSDPDEMEKFENLGGHSDPAKCASVVGKAAQWVMEILLDKGIVQLQNQ